MAIHLGFEGSQVLLGSCCGFFGAMGTAWALKEAPQLAMLWYTAGAVLGSPAKSCAFEPLLQDVILFKSLLKGSNRVEFQY